MRKKSLFTFLSLASGQTRCATYRSFTQPNYSWLLAAIEVQQSQNHYTESDFGLTITHAIFNAGKLFSYRLKFRLKKFSQMLKMKKSYFCKNARPLVSGQAGTSEKCLFCLHHHNYL